MLKYTGDKKLFKLWISPIFQSTCGYEEGYEGEEPCGYEGVIEGLHRDSHFVDDAPITFDAKTEKKVIEYAISFLKSEGFSGKLDGLTNNGASAPLSRRRK